MRVTVSYTIEHNRVLQAEGGEGGYGDTSRARLSASTLCTSVQVYL